MSSNFQLKRLKLKLDMVEKPENRVHELTDSNVSLLLSCRSVTSRVRTPEHCLVFDTARALFRKGRNRR